MNKKITAALAFLSPILLTAEVAQEAEPALPSTSQIETAASADAETDVSVVSSPSKTSTPGVWLGEIAGETPALEGPDFYDRFLKNRLSIGLTVVSTHLTDAERPEDKGAGKTFVGFIYKLEDEDKSMVVPTVSYWIPEVFIRLGVSWDSISGRTRNYNKTRHSDGVVKTEGPAFFAEAVIPLFDDRVLLHAGAGVVVAKSDFTEDTWWHLGYSSENAWIQRGSPMTVSGHYREIQVDDVTAPIITGGVSWRPFEHVEIDVSGRYVKMEPDCEFGYSSGTHFHPNEGGDFTLHHASVAATVSFVF